LLVDESSVIISEVPLVLQASEDTMDLPCVDVAGHEVEQESPVPGLHKARWNSGLDICSSSLAHRGNASFGKDRSSLTR
jgi:hypothetical protein